MFIIRYNDINKTVKMKIEKSIIWGSISIGGMLAFSYYSNNMIFQMVTLFITIIYAFITNQDMLKEGIKIVKMKLRR